MTPLVDNADTPAALRHGSAGLLALALMDSRNHTLRLLAHHEHPALLRHAAHAGWFQEYWVGRHVQRGRGEACDPQALRLGSVDPLIEAWLADTGPVPDLDTVRGYLAETLDGTLDLLAQAADDDRALFAYRLVLLHEDRLGEAMVEALDGQGHGAPPARPERPALLFPAQRLQLGSAAGGLVPENERWAHAVDLPEFEIDAQALSWARYIEFAEDGGYDRAELWSAPGWAWVQATGRRAPRHVEQLRGAVLVQRGGALQRVSPAQPALHLSRFEAEAWCRWAGRRLPTEPEWEAAALAGAPRGFVWGDVFEWVAGSARAWPGHTPCPGGLDNLPAPGTAGVLRGASWITRGRLRHPKARRFASPERDTMFCGFRSCAL